MSEEGRMGYFGVKKKINMRAVYSAGAPAIIPIPFRETVIPLVDNTADLTPVTVYVV